MGKRESYVLIYGIILPWGGGRPALDRGVEHRVVGVKWYTLRASKRQSDGNDIASARCLASLEV